MFSFVFPYLWDSFFFDEIEVPLEVWLRFILSEAIFEYHLIVVVELVFAVCPPELLDVLVILIVRVADYHHDDGVSVAVWYAEPLDTLYSKVLANMLQSLEIGVLE